VSTSPGAGRGGVVKGEGGGGGGRALAFTILCAVRRGEGSVPVAPAEVLCTCFVFVVEIDSTHSKYLLPPSIPLLPLSLPPPWSQRSFSAPRFLPWILFLFIILCFFLLSFSSPSYYYLDRGVCGFPNLEKVGESSGVFFFWYSSSFTSVSGMSVAAGIAFSCSCL
jgi:hypothetical protein